MTCLFGTEVVIGCVDVAGCGAAVIHAIDAPAVPLQVPSAAKASAALAFAKEGCQPLDAFSVKHVTDTSGNQVSFLGVNAAHSEDLTAVRMAHGIAQLLRDTPEVKRVTLLGAEHLPAATEGQLQVACSGDTAVPEALKGAATLPGDTKLKDEVLASLHYWLTAAGLPVVVCLVPGHRQAQAPKLVPRGPCAVLAQAVRGLSGAKVALEAIEGLQIVSERGAPVVDSLMYS